MLCSQVVGNPEIQIREKIILTRTTAATKNKLHHQLTAL